jgi:hypothetical protein
MFSFNIKLKQMRYFYKNAFTLFSSCRLEEINNLLYEGAFMSSTTKFHMLLGSRRKRLPSRDAIDLPGDELSVCEQRL